jgi:hypothetical protein
MMMIHNVMLINVFEPTGDEDLGLCVFMQFDAAAAQVYMP